MYIRRFNEKIGAELGDIQLNDEWIYYYNGKIEIGTVIKIRLGHFNITTYVIKFPKNGVLHTYDTTINQIIDQVGIFTNFDKFKEYFLKKLPKELDTHKMSISKLKNKIEEEKNLFAEKEDLLNTLKNANNINDLKI